MKSSERGVIVLIDEKGKKHLVVPGSGMKHIGGLGVVNTDELDSGSGRVSVAGKEYSAAPATLPDILHCIKRGPQWIMPKDGFQIIYNCSIGPGDRVLEIGTGTGALTIMLAHAVGMDGKVVSYELKQEHHKLAKRNIDLAGFSSVVEARLGDGGSVDELGKYDAVTIDMPEPWGILEACAAALKPGGYICAYIPTMNQAEKTLNALRELGFSETHAMENLQRELVVGKGGTRPGFDMLGHTGYLCFGRKL